MKVDRAHGRLRGVRFVPSPHQEARPPGVAVELVVIHGISLPPHRFGGPWIEDLFLGRLDPGPHPYLAGVAHLRVAPHLLIRRAGAVTQYVPLHRRAWHAGESTWRGRPGCNDYSVGIELEGSQRHPYTPAQYHRLADVLHALAAAYPGIRLPEHVVGHADVAPGRKRDPWDTFDWPLLRRLTQRPAPLAAAGPATGSSMSPS